MMRTQSIVVAEAWALISPGSKAKIDGVLRAFSRVSRQNFAEQFLHPFHFTFLHNTFKSHYFRKARYCPTC